MILNEKDENMDIEKNFSDVLSTYPNYHKLSSGGQKVVYSINHPKYGHCVLKIGCVPNGASLERILREVQTLQKIDSKYYPKNYEFQILSNNRFFIVEEFLDGDPLSNHLSQFSDIKNALYLLRKMVEGLIVIWDMNIVHRDLKPNNIIITPDRDVRIIDLGIARLLDETSITKTSAIRGPHTPVYAAPEQLQNRKSEIDIRTDQFNLGIIFLQLLLKGQHPFDPALVKKGLTIDENILNDLWYRDLFSDANYFSIKPLIEKLLGKEPHMRFRSPDLIISCIDQNLGVK